MRQWRAIALDVGGVIYYDEPFELAWIHDVLARALATDSSVTVSSFIDDMAHFYSVSATSRVTTVFSGPLAGDSWQAVRARWRTLVQPIPGAVDAVHRLASRYDICVVANQPPECADALELLGLAHVFRFVALDSIVGYAKPDPRLLGWAIGKLDLTPAHVLAVGNRWDHDIAPARSLGCQTMLVRQDSRWVAPAGSLAGIVAAYRSIKEALHVQPPDIDPSPAVANLIDLAAALGSPADAGRMT